MRKFPIPFLGKFFCEFWMLVEIYPFLGNCWKFTFSSSHSIPFSLKCSCLLNRQWHMMQREKHMHTQNNPCCCLFIGDLYYSRKKLILFLSHGYSTAFKAVLQKLTDSLLYNCRTFYLFNNTVNRWMFLEILNSLIS
jgi:hypothetical protein